MIKEIIDKGGGELKRQPRSEAVMEVSECLMWLGLVISILLTGWEILRVIESPETFYLAAPGTFMEE